MIEQASLFDVTPAPHGAARRTDPETSHEAARAMTGEKLSAIKHDILDCFMARGPMTDEELCDILMEAHPGDSTLRKRRGELRDAGYIIDSAQRKLNRGGHKMVVWMLKGETE